MFKIACKLCAVALVLALMPACQKAKYGRYNVTVALDNSLKRGGQYPTFDVDLIAVSEDDKARRWDPMKVSDYFAPDNPRRKQRDVFSMKFKGSGPSQQTLAKTDKIWTQEWAGKPFLLVIADLRSVPGDSDKKMFLPLDTREWTSDSLQLEVRNTGLERVTQPRPK